MNSILRGALSLVLCAGLATQSSVANAAFQDDEELPDPSTLSDDEKLEWAKKLYLQAKEFHDTEDYYNSVIKYEQAYSYAPDKHIFAYNLGVDAWELKDCARVKQYLQLFLIKDEDNEELQADAREILKKADNNPECITGGPGAADPGPADPTPTTSGPATDDEEPILTAKGDDGSSDTDTKKKGPSGLLIGGAILAVLGAGALGGGIGTTVIGSSTANELNTLATPGDTGFVNQEYDNSVVNMENKLDTMNTVSPILIGAGGALLAGGIALIVVDVMNKKKGKGHYADKSGKVQLTGLGLTPSRGGASASLSLRF